MAVTPLTLDEMVTDLRAEIGHSLLITHGVNQEETLKHYLQRTQRELYAANDWPYLIIDVTATTPAGVKLVSVPAGLTYDQINAIWCAVGSQWVRVGYGINPEHYSLYNPDFDARGWPVQRYKPDPVTGKIEVWPLPSQTAKLLFRGQQTLKTFVSGSDVSTLDGTMIVMFAAADYCARQKDEDAGLKLSKAQAYLNNIRKQLAAHKSRVTPMTPRRTSAARPGLDYIPMGGG